MHRFVLIVTLIALLCAALVSAFSDKAMTKYGNAGHVCNPEVGSSADDVEEAMQQMPASTYEGKCMRACVMKRFHLMNPSGKLNAKITRAEAEEYVGHDETKLDIAMIMIEICSIISVSDDHCEAADTYSNCFFREARKRGLKLTPDD